MPTLSVIPVAWSGGTVVGPGVSVLHCNEGDEDGLITAARAFFDAIKDFTAALTQWTFPTGGNTIDELTGLVNGSWAAGSVSPVVSGGSGAFVNGTGCRVVWRTIGVVGGRHVNGSTFIVPLAAGAFEGAGNLAAAVITGIQGPATVWATGPNAPRIYSRKNSHHAGISFPALSASVPDKVSWLRSRRV